MKKQIFVNVAVKDLQKSIAFFRELGFSFKKEFTNEKATCMVVAENIFVMLLVEHFFKGFTKTELCDAHKNTEAIMGIAVESREEVNEIVWCRTGNS